MSSIDERIVQMQFENSQFEKGVKETVKSLNTLKKNLQFDDATEEISELQRIGNSFSLSNISKQLEKLVEKTSWFSRNIMRAVDSVTDSFVGLSKNLTIGQVGSGWSKYELKTASVQTILNATGKSIDEVNGHLDKLMWFSDETSYNFTEMTSALGALTSSGGDIEKMIPMIEGMATATAFAGKSASEFSRIIYNLNQSYGLGYLSYADWRSVELAGVGSEQLKRTLIEAGVAAGTLKRLSDGTYKTSKGTKVTIANMSSTLNEKWATTEVMEKGFGNFAEVMEEAYKLVQDGKYDTASEAIESLAGSYDDTYYNAAKAAQEAKSFNEAIAATTDAVSSGWMKTFEIIFGNYEEAKTLWTDLANALWEVFASGGEDRNSVLSEWKRLGGRADLIQGITDALTGLWAIIRTIKDAFFNIFPKATATDLLKISTKIKELGSNLKQLAHTWTEVRKAFGGSPIDTLLGDFEIKRGDKNDDVKALQQKLTDLGYGDLLGEAGIDGIFGKNTEIALKKWQEDAGLVVDGIFDNVDEEKLKLFTKSDLNVPILEKIEHATPFLERISRIFKGGFSVFSILGKGFSFLAKAAWKVLKIFGPFGNVILEFLAGIGDRLTAFNQMIDDSGKLDEWLDSLDGLLKPAADSIEHFSDVLMSFLTGSTIAEVKHDVDKITDIFETVKTAVKDFIGWIESRESGENFLDKFHIYDVVVAGLSVMAAIISANLIKIVTDITTAVRKIKNAVKNITGKIEGLTGNSTVTKWLMAAQVIFKIAISIAILAAAVYALSTLSLPDLAKGIGALAVIVGILVGGLYLMNKIFTSSMIAYIDTQQISKLASSILLITISIAILSISVIAVAQLDWGELARGLIGLVVMMGALLGFVWGMSKIKFDNSTIGVIAELAGFVAAIWSMAQIVILLGKNDIGTLGRGIIAMALLMGSLIGFKYLLSNVNTSTSSVLSLIPVVLAIDLLIAGFVVLAITMKFLSNEAAVRSVFALASIVTVLGLLIKACESLHPNIGALLSLIPVVLAIDLLIAGFVVLAITMKFLSNEAMARSLAALMGIVLVLGLLIKACESLHPNIGALLSLIPVVLAIDLLIAGFVALAITMKFLSNEAMVRSLAALMGIVLVLGLFMTACKTIKPNIGALLSLIPVVLAIDLLIAGFVVLAITMKFLSNEAMVRSLAALMGIVLVLGLLIKACESLHPNIGALLSLIPVVLAIDLLIAGFVALAITMKFLSNEAMVRSLAALMGIVLALGLFMTACKTIKPSIQSIASIIIFAASLSLLMTSFAALALAMKRVDNETMARSLVALIGIAVVLGLFMTACKAINPSLKSVISVIPIALALSILIVSFSYAIRYAKNVKTTTLVGFAIGLGVIFVAFAATCAIAKETKLLSGLGMIISSISIILVIAAVAVALKSIQDIDTAKVVAFTTGIGAMFVGLGSMMRIAAVIGVVGMAKAAVAVAAALAIIVVAILAILATLALLNIGGIAEKVANAAGKVIYAIGKALGQFAAGYMTALADGMAAMRSAVEGISENKNLDSDLASAFAMIKSVVEFFSEFSRMRTVISWNEKTKKNMTMILENIREFGEAIGAVATGIKGLSKTKYKKDAAAAEELAIAVTETLDVLNGIGEAKFWGTAESDLSDSWNATETHLGTLLELIGKFGTIVGQVKDGVNGLSKNTKTDEETGELTGGVISDTNVASIIVIQISECLTGLAELSKDETWKDVYDQLNGTYESTCGEDGPVSEILDLIGKFGNIVGQVREGVDGLSSGGSYDEKTKTWTKTATAIRDTDVGMQIVNMVVESINQFSSIAEYKTWAKPIALVNRIFGGGKTYVEQISEDLKSFGESLQTIRDAVDGLAEGVDINTDKKTGAKTYKKGIVKDTEVGIYVIDMVIEYLNGILTKYGVDDQGNSSVMDEAETAFSKFSTTNSYVLENIMADVTTFGKYGAELFQELQGLGTADNNKDIPAIWEDYMIPTISSIIGFMSDLHDQGLDELAEAEDRTLGLWGGTTPISRITTVIADTATMISDLQTALNAISSTGFEDDAETAVNAFSSFYSLLDAITEEGFDTELNYSEQFIGYINDGVDEMVSGIKTFIEKTAYNNKDGIGHISKNSSLISDLQTAIDIYYDVFNLLRTVQALSEGKQTDKFVWDEVSEEVFSSLTGMAESISTFTDYMSDVDDEDLNKLVSFMDSLAKVMGGVQDVSKVSDLLTDIKNLFTGDSTESGTPQWIKDLNSEETIDEMSNFITNFTSAITPGVDEINTLFEPLGRNMAMGVGKGMLEAAPDVDTTYISPFVQKVIDYIKAHSEISSPSRVTAVLGSYMAMGLGKGMADNSKYATDGAGKMCDSVFATLSSALAEDVNMDPIIRPIVDMSDVESSSRRLNGLLSADRSIDLASGAVSSFSRMKAAQKAEAAAASATSGDGYQNSSYNDSVSLTGNNFYIRSEQDIHTLANEIASLTRQQQRSLGARY